MNILGVNISHDTSVASITDDTIDFVFDEARFRRQKYWEVDDMMRRNEEGLQCIVQRNIPTPDKLIVATFDRRGVKLSVPYEDVVCDRLKSMEFCRVFQNEQFSNDTIQKLIKDYEITEERMEDSDALISRVIADQVGVDKFHLDFEHHLYHAECVHALSPWKGEECLAVVWDGGGVYAEYDTYPTHQEMETLYHCVPGKTPRKIWQRLSNHRFLIDMGWTFPNLPYDCLVNWEDEVLNRDGVEIVISSRPSSGMNFSNLSKVFGCDDQGRAAGKIMGMASYGSVHPNAFNQYSVAQQCELESLTNSINIIQKGIDLLPHVNKILLSGGYSLNCTNNYKYLTAFPDHKFFVDPIPHDGGTALGACLWLKRHLAQGDNND